MLQIVRQLSRQYSYASFGFVVYAGDGAVSGSDAGRVNRYVKPVVITSCDHENQVLTRICCDP